jgi:hypothetical protein
MRLETAEAAIAVAATVLRSQRSWPHCPGLTIEITRRLRLIVDSRHPQASKPSGHFPFKFVSDPIPEHSRTDWSEHGNLAFFDIRGRRENKSPGQSLAAFEVKQVSARIHRDHIIWDCPRVHDHSPLQLVTEGI